MDKAGSAELRESFMGAQSASRIVVFWDSCF